MASFQAIIGWNRPRNRENKNYHFIWFQPDAKQKIHKKLQKNSKNYKILLWLHFKPKIMEETLINGENKNYRPIPFQSDA